MRTSHRFRVWVVSGPVTERVSAGLAALLALILVFLAVLPTGSHAPGTGLGTLGSPAASAGPVSGTPGAPSVSGSGPAGGAVGSGAGGAAPGSAEGGAVTPSSSGQAAGGAEGSVPTGGGQCGNLTSTDKGVTSNQILIGVVIPDLGSLGGAEGLPSFQQQQSAFNAIFDSYNQSGGVQCRKLVPKYYDDMVLDASGEHADCLQMVQDGVFAVVNNLYNPQESTCVAQQHIPNVWYTPPHTGAERQFYPYLLSDFTNYDRLIKDYVFGAKEAGFFTGMHKLGILEQSCFPDEDTDIAASLSAAGIPDSQIERYNYGCPGVIAPPSDSQAAVLQFKRDGVTHVMNVTTYVTNFGQSAGQQDYHPKIALMEDGVMSGMTSQNPAPDPSFEGTLGVATDQIGAATTPGVAVSPATTACAKILAKIGYPPPTQSARQGLAGTLAGNACAIMTVLVAAMRADVPLVRTGLAQALAGAGQLDLSYPAGPFNVTNPADPSGGQYYRTARWSSGCTCWHVIDQTWHKGFN